MLEARAEALIQKGIAEKEKITYTGFVAQQVEAAAKKIGYDFSGVDKPQNEYTPYGLRYAEFVVPLVKAVQELASQNEELKSQNDDQKFEIQNLKSEMNNLKTMVESLQQNFNNCNPCAQQSVSSEQATVSIVQPQTQNAKQSNASLTQNIPNPFSHATTINYTLPQTYSSAKIIVTDKSGKMLKEMSVSGTGKGRITVDASLLAGGAYQYSLYVDGKQMDTKQMILTK